MSLFEPSEVVTFFPRRAIGGLSATVTLEEISSDELETTQHPVQQGASITDHAYLKPANLSMKVMWNSDDRPLAETYQALINLQASREPFDIVTGKRIYSNMLFKSLGVTTDAFTENVLSINADFVEIFVTALEVVTVPPRKQQKNPGKTGATQNAGKKNATEEGNPAKKRSALRALAG